MFEFNLSFLVIDVEIFVCILLLYFDFFEILYFIDCIFVWLINFFKWVVDRLKVFFFDFGLVVCFVNVLFIGVGLYVNFNVVGVIIEIFVIVEFW